MRGMVINMSSYKKKAMTLLIIDAYVDEPSILGVPPYISPYPRYVYGAAVDAGEKVEYRTIDHIRRHEVHLADYDLFVVIGGVYVPGKYLRTLPGSLRELEILVEKAMHHGDVFMMGPAREHFRRLRLPGVHTPLLDGDAALYDHITAGEWKSRRRTMDEWKKWSVLGAKAVKDHPDHPQPLICEVETYRGCVRYFTGGCSFCSEPAHGKPVFREPSQVAAEVEALYENGCVNFRLGGQTCIFSYMADGVGKTETPTPSPSDIETLFRGIRRDAPGLRVLHVDNANPAVIAAHPRESEEIARILVEYCTSGNVVSFGLESADPVVARENNLNATPQQTLEAVRLINMVGGERGENGMPELLPGINFLSGLRGERPETFDLNMEFLRKIMKEGLLLRRINIRQVVWHDKTNTPGMGQKRKKHREHRRLIEFKEKVRREIDHPMLKRLVPAGTVLRDVYMEKNDGGTTFGRQIGSYPLLVGIPYPVEVERFVDVTITDHGMRSVTGIICPFNINTAPIKALQAIPGIGEKRAVKIAGKRPLGGVEDLVGVLGDENLAREIVGKYNVVF